MKILFQIREISIHANECLGTPLYRILRNMLYTNTDRIIRFPGLPAHPATVHGNEFSRDVATGTASQKDDHALEVLRLAPSSGRDPSHDAGIAVGIVDQRNIHVGINVSGSNGVDIDALGHPLVGERLGQLADAALGGCIGGDSNAALESEERGDVDNVTATAGGELGFVTRQQIGAEFTAEHED